MVEAKFILWRQKAIEVSININSPSREREITIRRVFYRRKTFWVVLLKCSMFVSSVWVLPPAHHPKALSTMAGEILRDKSKH